MLHTSGRDFEILSDYQIEKTNEINKSNIGKHIKELELLLAECKIPLYKKKLETDIKSYNAIKDLFDAAVV